MEMRVCVFYFIYVCVLLIAYDVQAHRHSHTYLDIVLCFTFPCDTGEVSQQSHSLRGLWREKGAPQREWSSIGCPGKWWSLHPWRPLKDV